MNVVALNLKLALMAVLFACGACSLLNESVASDGSSPLDLASGAAFDFSQITACTLQPQAGCGTGQKCTYKCNPASMQSGNCTVVSGDLTYCVAEGSISTGGACSPDPDSCMKSDLCVLESASSGLPVEVWMCRQFCSSDADCQQPPQLGGPNNKPHCLVDPGGGVKVCTVACNPVTAAGPSGCPTSTSCQGFSTTAIAEATDCRYEMNFGTDGVVCTTMADCAPGYSCVNGSSLRCRQNCRAGTVADCTELGAGASCQLPTGATMFGVCCPTAGGC